MYSDKKKVKWSVDFLDSTDHSVTEYFDREVDANNFCKKVKGTLKTIAGLPEMLTNGVPDPKK